MPVCSPAFSGTHCTYSLRDGQAELAWVTGNILGWFTHVQMVTHPSTNPAVLGQELDSQPVDYKISLWNWLWNV